MKIYSLIFCFFVVIASGCASVEKRSDVSTNDTAINIGVRGIPCSSFYDTNYNGFCIKKWSKEVNFPIELPLSDIDYVLQVSCKTQDGIVVSGSGVVSHRERSKLIILAEKLTNAKYMLCNLEFEPIKES